MVRWRLAVEEGLDSGQEVVGDSAADAAVGELEDVAVLAAFDAAALEDFGVDADIAELVDDEREAPSVRVARRWRIMLVLPAPRKPVMTVAGMRVVMGKRPGASAGARSRTPPRWIRDGFGRRARTHLRSSRVIKPFRAGRGKRPVGRPRIGLCGTRSGRERRALPRAGVGSPLATTWPARSRRLTSFAALPENREVTRPGVRRDFVGSTDETGSR